MGEKEGRWTAEDEFRGEVIDAVVVVGKGNSRSKEAGGNGHYCCCKL